jgi:Flp pilus assembly protein TadB
MELIIALLIAVLAFTLAYNLIYRHRLTASHASRQLHELHRVDDGQNKVDPSSPEYKLAQAGIRTATPVLTWALLNWGPPLGIFVIVVGVGFPLTVALAGAVIGFLAPRRWLDGKIKDRGRRIDDEIPKAYVRLLSVLRASPDVGLALSEVADTLELEKNGPTLLSIEFRVTAAEMADPNVGREEGLRRLQKRAASVSLSNLGLLLERFAQTGGDRFYGSFETASQNVQGILDARQKAQSKAAEQMQSARIVPGLLAVTLLFFMNDPGFVTSFQLPLVQIALAGAAVVMFVGYGIMADIAREAV